MEGMVLDLILIQEEMVLEEMVQDSLDLESALMVLVLANWVLVQLLNSTDMKMDLKLDLGHLLSPSNC